MFEEASRLKLRFQTEQGMLSVEDLWSLPLESRRGASLDDIAIGLHRELQDTGVSFVRDTSGLDQVLQLKFNIVKHIIDVRIDENKKAALLQVNAARKQKLLELLADKQDGDLRAKSAEELEALIKEL